MREQIEQVIGLLTDSLNGVHRTWEKFFIPSNRGVFLPSSYLKYKDSVKAAFEALEAIEKKSVDLKASINKAIAALAEAKKTEQDDQIMHDEIDKELKAQFNGNGF